MATFKTFEDIDAWQKARELTKGIYLVSNQGAFSRDFGLREQIRKSDIKGSKYKKGDDTKTENLNPGTRNPKPKSS